MPCYVVSCAHVSDYFSCRIVERSNISNSSDSSHSAWLGALGWALHSSNSSKSSNSSSVYRYKHSFCSSEVSVFSFTHSYPIILGRFTGQFRCSDGHMARFSHWYPSILATSAVIGVATVGWVTFSITTMFDLANVT